MPSGLEKEALNGEQRQSQQLGSKRLNNMGEGREVQTVCKWAQGYTAQHGG